MQLAGILDIVLDAARNFNLNCGTNQAAAIGFFALLSIIPLLILTMILVNYFFGSFPGAQELLFEAINEYHPYISEKLFEQLGRVEEKKRLMGGLGLLSLAWLAIMVVRALGRSLNMIFRVEGKQNFIASTLIAMGIILLLWTATMVMIAANYSREILHLDHPLQELIFGSIPPSLMVLIDSGLPKLITVLMVGLSYKVIPKSRITFKNALAGGIIFTFLMATAKSGFSLYLANYARYGVIYGSLDVLIIVIIWIFFLSLIFLFTAELVSSYCRRDLILLERIILGQKKKMFRVADRIYRKFGQTYQPGAFIFKEGDSGQEMFYILRGRVQMEKRAGDITRVLAQMGEGDYFGEMALLVDTQRTASAKVMETSLIATIQPKTFRALIRENEEVALLMLREFSRRLKNTGILLEELSQSWSRLMVAAYIILQEKSLPADAHDISARLAAITGKDTGEIAALLESLHQLGLLTGENGKITSIDKSGALDLIKNVKN